MQLDAEERRICGAARSDRNLVVHMHVLPSVVSSAVQPAGLLSLLPTADMMRIAVKT